MPPLPSFVEGFGGDVGKANGAPRRLSAWASSVDATNVTLLNVPYDSMRALYAKTEPWSSASKVASSDGRAVIEIDAA